MNSKILILLLLLVPGLAGAQLYKHVDEEGRVTYTDQPQDIDDEEYIPPNTVNDVDMPKAARPGTVIRRKPKPPPPRYFKLQILSPAQDTVVRDNEGNVSITLKAEPELQSADGHFFGLYLDGKYIEKTADANHTLKNLDRGTHELIVVIQDSAGKPLISTDKLVFHVKRFFR